MVRLGTVPRVPAACVMRIDLDMPVSCVDGAVGQLADVIIAPGSRRLTHIVVQPHDRLQLARLVPADKVRGGESDGPAANGLALDCTLAAINGSEPIQDCAFIRTGELIDGGPDWDVGIQDPFPLPDEGSLSSEMMGSGMAMEYGQHMGVNYHRIPSGEVEIRRASAVTSTDGHHVGHVVGFVIDDDDLISGLVLEHGHLWGKRMVPVPGPAIDRLTTDEVVLTLSADEVGELEPLPSDHHWRL